jgi:cytoskeleton protein RodZ
MTSVGETLRRERLKRNLDIESISRELKISRRLLDAIEADQYDRLPGGVFAKAFVRQYAQLMELDADDLAAQVQRAIDPPAPPFAEHARPAVIPQPVAMPKREEWKSVGDRRFRISGSLPAAALVVVVMLVCSAVYAWIQRPRTSTIAKATPAIRIESHTEPAPPPAAVAQPAQPATTEPASFAPQAEVPTPQLVQPVPAAPPKPVEALRATAPAGPVHVEIVADEVVWVLARADGKFAFSGTMEPNSRRVLDGEKDVMLRLGNAGGVTVLLNGKPIGPAGPKGQTRTLQFTSGGFQIVSAKPVVAVPLDPLDRL